MADITSLGKLIDADEKRDAIHIAVAPVVAVERLSPGQPIGLVPATTDRAIASAVRLIGIVDPFLKGPVLPGDRFWMFLNPGSITSLRHDWTHPAFAEVPEAPPKLATNEYSEQWLRDFCAQEGPDYDLLIAAAKNPRGYASSDDGDLGVRIDSDYLTVIGRDAYGDIPGEFWVHLEAVTGRKGPRPPSFTCSC